MLKIVTKEEFDKLPEALKEHYVEKDGKYVPQVEGLVPEGELAQTKAKLAEFRDNNIRVMKENDQLKEKLQGFDGINLEEYSRLKAEHEKLKQQGIGNSADLAKLFEQQIAKAVKPLQDKLDAAEAKSREADLRLAQKAVDEHITRFAVKAGVDPDVLPDVLQRARQVFTFKDDAVVAMKGDLPIFSSERPDQPLGAEEWLSTLPKAFFKPSAGGGAHGSDGNPAAKTLVRPDAVTIGKNLEDIASGKIAVTM